MRAFVAVEVIDEQTVNVIKRFQDKSDIDGRPVKTENFHFTLQFLGEIFDDTADKVIKALKTIKFSSFDVTLSGVGAFPKMKFPRVIWIGTDRAGGNKLVELSKKVLDTLEPLGLVLDKSFKPHMTVFRIKKRIGDISGELENSKMINFGVQRVSSIKLKKSELKAEGSVYFDITEIGAIK